MTKAVKPEHAITDEDVQKSYQLLSVLGLCVFAAEHIGEVPEDRHDAHSQQLGYVLEHVVLPLASHIHDKLEFNSQDRR